jgi:hypothetical protein
MIHSYSDTRHAVSDVSDESETDEQQKVTNIKMADRNGNITMWTSITFLHADRSH